MIHRMLLSFNVSTTKMAGYEWLKEELAIVVYYASEGVPHHVLAQLLHRRNFTRTMVAVRNQLNAMRVQKKLGEPWSHWNIDAVDKWLDEISDEIDVNEIIKPTDEDQEILNRVSQSFIAFVKSANHISTT